jgi:phosphoglycerate dehydrogenase-like enzyme/CMP-N-acetylneuraminic acid synthetase
MKKNHKILAVIQARSGSKGIPKKNIYPINGYPLIAYTISAARDSQLISDVVVSTDSEEFSNIAIEYGAQAPFLRPSNLSGDKVTSIDSLLHAAIETEKILKTKYDFFIELPCVSPMRDSFDIDEALELLMDDPEATSVTSFVGTGEKHPVRLKKIINNRIHEISNDYQEPNQVSRRQDLTPDAYIRNGAIYAMTRDTLLKEKSRHGNQCIPYIMSEEKSVNIDNFEDLRLAEFKIRDGSCNNIPYKFKLISPRIFLNPKQKGTLLITTPTHFLPTIESRLNKNFSCIYAHNASKEMVINLMSSHNIEGWICNPCPKYIIDKDIISFSKSLRSIVTTSTGSNHINYKDCEEKDVQVFSLKGTEFVKSITASSEFAFSLLLAVVRNLPQAFNSAMSFSWREEEDRFRGEELAGKTLGIIGFGRIGSNVAKYAAAMEMQITAFDPNVEIPSKYNPVDSSKLVLQHSDVVLISVHLDPSTENLVDSSWFQLMKRGAYFINISRGEIVIEGDLLDALRSGHLSAAGLDVIRDEISGDIKSSLVIQYARENSNLIITPHIAGLTIDSEMKAAIHAATIMEKFFNLERV